MYVYCAGIEWWREKDTASERASEREKQRREMWEKDDELCKFIIIIFSIYRCHIVCETHFLFLFLFHWAEKLTDMIENNRYIFIVDLIELIIP